MGLSVRSLHESNIFGVSAVFGMSAGRIFSQCVLAFIPRMGGVVLVGGTMTGACPGCRVGPPFCSVVVTALFGSRIYLLLG